MKYGYRDHRELLEDSLSTKVYIDEKDFRFRLKKYEFYGYDERCRQILFIRKDNSVFAPWWLFIELQAGE